MGKAIFKILFGLIYTLGYFFLAILSTGGGHGNFYLLLPLIPWLLLFVPIFLFGKLNDSVKQIVFVLVMITHYLVSAIFLFNYSFAEDRGWKIRFPYEVFAWYLAGQLVIWVNFFDEVIINKKKPDDSII